MAWQRHLDGYDIGCMHVCMHGMAHLMALKSTNPVACFSIPEHRLTILACTCKEVSVWCDRAVLHNQHSGSLVERHGDFAPFKAKN